MLYKRPHIRIVGIRDMSFVNMWIIHILLLVLLCAYTKGFTTTVGDAFISPSAKDGGVQGIFLMTDKTIVHKAAVLYFYAYVTATGPVWLQVWRPVGNNLQVPRYRLVGQVHFQAELVPIMYNITIPRSQPILTEVGDIIGITNPEDKCPLAYKFEPQSKTYHSSVQNQSKVVPGFEADFTMTSFPYQFSIGISYETDFEQYASMTDATTDQSPTRSTIPSIPQATGTFRYLGNSLAGKTSYMRSNAQGMFIFPHLELAEGVVVRFYAHFVLKEAVSLQVWRPMAEAPGELILIGQHDYEPELVPQTLQIDLPSNNLIFSKPGDRVGFTIRSQVCPIGYKFIDNPAFVGPYRSSIVRNAMPQLGEIVYFNPEKHPYDFAIGVMYDTDTDSNKYGTPSATLPTIPLTPEKEVTSPPTQTTPLLVPVPEQLELIGRSYLQYAPKVLEFGSKRTFILPEVKFPSDGILFAFYAYIVKSGKVRFQIWRPEGRAGSQIYRLVGSKQVVVPSDSEPSLQQFYIEEGNDLFVTSGDCIGFANEQESSVVGYQFMPAMLMTSEIGLLANVSDSVVFDTMPFPYKFSIGAVYKAVTMPTTNAPEYTNENDYTDETKDKENDKTDGVPISLPVGKPVDISWTMDSRFVFGLFIWLCALTLLFLILAICACVLCCRLNDRKNQEDMKRTSFLYDYESRNSVTRPPSAYLSSAHNKDGATIDYFNPKTGVKTGPVMRNDSMKERLLDESVDDIKRSLRRGQVNKNNNNIVCVAEIGEYAEETVEVMDRPTDFSTHM